MKSDLERLEKLFDDFNIEYKLEGIEEFPSHFIKQEPDVARILHIDEGVGYYGFCTEFWFDVAGEFLKYGVWEE